MSDNCSTSPERATGICNEPPLDYIFHPRSIAVVGLSTEPAKAWLSDCYITPMVNMGFKGPLYVINSKGGEIAGFSVYKRLQDVPGPVDHLVSCIPAEFTADLLEECVAKGVKVIQFYTAGFAETGLKEDLQLQAKLLDIARRGGLRLIGPNCMGIYCPQSGVGFCPDFPAETGPIGLLCQSGGNTGYIVRSVAARGLRFSKVVSYGNACDINECDLLEYMADDPETTVIAVYIEGTRDGRRLLDSLARAASAKPVVILKGGHTPGGSRATASHTGSLAGVDAVWDGLLAQAGAIRVHSVEAMADVLVAILGMRVPRGINTCVVGLGGGANVLATDDCEQAGLRLPPIPPGIADRVETLIPRAGGMLTNPLDAFPMVGSPEGWRKLVPILDDWSELDLVIFHYAFGGPPVPASHATIEPALRPMLSAAKTSRLPVAVVLHSTPNNDSWQASLKVQEMVLETELPLFTSMGGAAHAIRRVTEFNSANPGRLPRLQSQDR
ncbi:CoA-binding protein [Chloroflexota bacterium]